MSARATVIGAGLAGCEAAWQLAKRGVRVDIYEMRPAKRTPAHTTALCAELVCSNSLGSNELSTAKGLLKQELRQLESLIIGAADACAIPAGGALAVDRAAFAASIDSALRADSNITFHKLEGAEERVAPLIS